MILAVQIAVFHEGRVLAMQRSSSKRVAPLLWETISGRIEADEEPIEAARREVYEESGLDVRVDPRPICAYRAAFGDEPMMVIGFVGHADSGQFIRNEEHADAAWLTLEEFESLCAEPRIVEFVRTARDALGIRTI